MCLPEERYAAFIPPALHKKYTLFFNIVKTYSLALLKWFTLLRFLGGKNNKLKNTN